MKDEVFRQIEVTGYEIEKISEASKTYGVYNNKNQLIDILHEISIPNENYNIASGGKPKKSKSKKSKKAKKSKKSKKTRKSKQ